MYKQQVSLVVSVKLLTLTRVASNFSQVRVAIYNNITQVKVKSKTTPKSNCFTKGYSSKCNWGKVISYYPPLPAGNM